MEKGTKNKKESKEEKQKDQKFEEQLLKSLEGAGTSDEKFNLLFRKHLEYEKNTRKVQQDLKTHEKQLDIILREKENLQREHNKSLLMRDKLTELCREQQKIIKSIKNESMAKIKEEEERRKESQLKFQDSLNDIQKSLTKNGEENNRLRNDNLDMAKKLQYLGEQYKTREKQYDTLMEQGSIKDQLHAAQMNKVQVQAAMEKEIMIREKQTILERLIEAQKLTKEYGEREAALKEQLNIYTSKYDDFQSSLQKSNDIFTTYKTELDKMSKNTRKLEKECFEWKRKYEKTYATLIELSTEKKERDDHAQRCNKQVEQLQKLLRALQHERTHLYKVLRDNNIEAPVLPPLPPEPETMKTQPITSITDRDKMELVSKNYTELKETLANLQIQMKNLKSAELAEASTSSANKATVGPTAPTTTAAAAAVNGVKNKKSKKKPKSKAKKNAESNAKEASPPPAAIENGDEKTEDLTTPPAATNVAEEDEETNTSVTGDTEEKELKEIVIENQSENNDTINAETINASNTNETVATGTGPPFLENSTATATTVSPESAIIENIANENSNVPLISNEKTAIHTTENQLKEPILPLSVEDDLVSPADAVSVSSAETVLLQSKDAAVIQTENVVPLASAVTDLLPPAEVDLLSPADAVLVTSADVKLPPSTSPPAPSSINAFSTPVAVETASAVPN